MNAPRPPILLDPCFGDAELIPSLIRRHGPYQPVQRYFANQAEFEAMSGADDVRLMVIAPNFRGDWAYDKPLVDGVEAILHHDRFVEAAARLFDAEVVRPQQVYCNLTWQLPFHQGGGHTDIPAFIGFDRTEWPITLLSIMGHSGLFEAERIAIATAVAWSHRGDDGGFEYWPDGPHEPPEVHEGAIDDTAIVGDNDFMWHRVRPVGRPEDGMVDGLTLDSRLVHRGDGDWAIEDGGRELAAFPQERIRVSVSWKATVFADDEAAARADAGDGGLTIDEVVRRFRDDLARRGVDAPDPGDDPARNPAWIRALQQTYVHEPTTAAP